MSCFLLQIVFTTSKFLLGLFVAGLAAFRVFLYFQRENDLKEMPDFFAELGEKLGIGPGENYQNYLGEELPAVEGEFRGFNMELYTDTKGTKQLTYFTVMKLYLKSEKAFEFDLGKESYMDKIGKALHLESDIETGHPEFDRFFLLKSNDKSFALQLFNPLLIEKLMEAKDLFDAPLSLAHNKIVYKERRLLGSEATVERFYEIAELMAAIAESYEKCAGRNLSS